MSEENRLECDGLYRQDWSKAKEEIMELIKKCV